MNSMPPPVPIEAVEEEVQETRTSVPRHPRDTRFIPAWGWWVIGLALVLVVGAGCYLYFGEQAILATVPVALVWAGWGIVGLAALTIYFIPAAVAMHYGLRRGGAIAMLNLLLGWTFIGWAGALVWAVAEVESLD